MITTRPTFRLFCTAAVAALVSGCTVVPMHTASKACDLLDIALAEADMSAGWYASTGETLNQCGVEDAIERAERKVCWAQKRDGHSCKEVNDKVQQP